MAVARLAGALLIVVALGTFAVAQTQKRDTPPKPIPMEELHRAGGVPRGWKFTLPSGDANAGRAIFAKLECNKCHEVQPDFPKTAGAGNAGPALTGMGANHPPEYFAQSIIDPNAVILAGPGYVGADGRSTMPDYRDSLTVTELVDLVAYIRSLSGGGEHHHPEANAPQEKTAGPYTVRVEYQEPTDTGHSHGATSSKRTGQLKVFLRDTATGETVPYVPVTATIAAVETAALTLRLQPVLDAAGFYYGADVTLPDDTVKITLTLGAARLKTVGAAAGRFGRQLTLSFDWE